MKIKEKEKLFNELSDHLFWDVNRSELNFEKNKKLVVQRVLDYGLFNDWKIIQKYYGIDEIAQIAIKIRDLGKKSVNFIATLSGINEEKFRCYILRQSKNKHWDF